MNRPLRLVRIVSTSFTFATLLYDQIAAIRDAGIELTLIADASDRLSGIAYKQNVAYHGIPVTRQPDLRMDVRALIALTRYLRNQPFDIIHSSTPKAGLLTALAGFLSKTPIRLHTYTGQRWVTLTGVQHELLRSFDRLIATLSTLTYADSASQRQFLINERIVRPDKIKVLGAGSISGVNMQRFDPACWGGEKRQETRRELGISADAVVIIFVGRVTHDKGIGELIKAFASLSRSHANLFLLLVGPFEPELDPLPSETLSMLQSHDRILVTGFCAEPEKFLAASDIFCLPSYREGFGSVIVEAGAMELPTVATAIVGLTDAVEENLTGLLVPPRNSGELLEALDVLIREPDRRKRMGIAARQRVERAFDATLVNQAVVKEYFYLANRQQQ